MIGVLLERIDWVTIERALGKVPALKPIKFPNADDIVNWGLFAVDTVGKTQVADVGFV